MYLEVCMTDIQQRSWFLTLVSILSITFQREALKQITLFTLTNNVDGDLTLYLVNTKNIIC